MNATPGLFCNFNLVTVENFNIVRMVYFPCSATGIFVRVEVKSHEENVMKKTKPLDAAQTKLSTMLFATL